MRSSLGEKYSIQFNSGARLTGTGSITNPFYVISHSLLNTPATDIIEKKKGVLDGNKKNRVGGPV